MDTIVYDAVQDVKAVAEYNGGGHRNPSRKRHCEECATWGVFQSVYYSE